MKTKSTITIIREVDVSGRVLKGYPDTHEEPGESPSVEDITATFNNKPIELTEDEEDLAKEAILDEHSLTDGD